ncbi:unnamed protein product, partial [Mesorhabditis belari]|uniref:3'(2'),5'-bisphosphate nucleotidase 1 n=1 Tax=Mesorhabditis belari TaxID=2138241 RepID=A0AAF3J6D1_9BILA
MWMRSCFLHRLVASSVKISEAAGGVIKDILCDGDLKIIDKGGSGKTADLQTEADRAAQYCIVKSLHAVFGDKITIIGEEETTSFTPRIEKGFCSKVLSLNDKCPENLRDINPEDVVIWVDPLDGTVEIANAAKKSAAVLAQVTVLIGIAYRGRPIAGVIHQPYYEGRENGRTVWAINGVGTYGMDYVKEDNKEQKIVVTTRSHGTSSVDAALDALNKKGLADTVVRVGGAGYKVMRILEGAAAYVFASQGCKKWDTAACEAVIEGTGGRLTDISGRLLNYEKGVQLNNTGGVLVTACWVDHQDYLNSIPDALKEALPEFQAKN